ncbi:hypothetical protein Pyn_12392 [Prunus yedoensis var. nudiflora]|uniref:Uncharacterized protein n=1 Tax=Prunus yedoensis var. nudiflora TaxID=2094558 RepID=A0A314ZLK4_PRUYE|nr:hypothetical protein Pyn_12392 [Prunus yedoensis var. nudiflora]
MLTSNSARPNRWRGRHGPVRQSFRAPATVGALEVGAAVEVTTVARAEEGVVTLGTATARVFDRVRDWGLLPFATLGGRGSQSTFFRATLIPDPSIRVICITT